MSNQVHINKLSPLFSELLMEINSLLLHPKNKLPSVKFANAKLFFVIHSDLLLIMKLNLFWRNVSNDMNIQYDVNKNTNDISKTIRSEHEDRLQAHLQSQGAILYFIIIDHSLSMTKSLWTSVQNKMPKNIFKFNLNNSHPTHNKMKKFNFIQSSDCSFCHTKTFLHVVAGCKSYLKETYILGATTLSCQPWLTSLGHLQDHVSTLIFLAFFYLPI